VKERDQDGGLDDLFAFADERAVEEPVEAAERPPSQAAWVLRNLLLVAVATVVAVAALRSAGIGVSVLLIVAAFVALRLLMLAVAEVAPPPVPKPDSPPSSDAGGDGLYRWAGTDSLRAAVRRWEQRLDWSRSDPDSFSRNVLPVLGELTDERLRLRHGITRASDPRRARELLGAELWAVLGGLGSNQRARSPKVRDLTMYVETLERL
jgi:hypothetical protein